MTNEPILTLFLLTYNQENSIRKTIESILSQKTKYPFIVKILEDCSTDKTLEICKEYVEKYPHLFKLIAQKVNTKGLHCRIAREKEVNTKYWCFIEGDDWYLNDLWIEKGISFLEQNQDYNCYCGDVLYSNEEENTKLSCVTEVQKKSFQKIGHDLSFDNYVYIQTSARMYRNVIDFSKIQEIPISDIYTWYLFLDKGKVYLEHEIMSQYNITPQGVWSGMAEKEKKERDFYRAIVCNNFFKYKYSNFFAKTIKNKKMKILKFLLGAKLAMKILYGDKEQIKEFTTKLKNNKARKKVLLLAGADFHCKVVRAAQELGIYVVVTDYLPVEKSPAKQIADEYWMLDIRDIDSIVEKCKKEKIDGVVAYCIDPAQIPYQQICEKLNLPCFGTKEQYKIFTNKILFKDFCRKNGIDVIPEYTIEDVVQNNVLYPVLVKPSDSRGSRGQTVCYDKESLLQAIDIAKNESSDEKFLIEKYMAGAQDFAVAYIVINNEPYLLKIADRYVGLAKDNLERQQILNIIPSLYTKKYIQNCENNVKKMIKNLGINFGAIFLQGFVEDDKVFFYDPGIRFPGTEFDIVLAETTKFNPMKSVVAYALTGDISMCFGNPINAYNLNGNICVVLSVAVRAGKIGKIIGFEEVVKNKNILSSSLRYSAGDIIPNSGDVKQRVCEFTASLSSSQEIEPFIKDVYSKLKILDEYGKEMIVSKAIFNIPINTCI